MFWLHRHQSPKQAQNSKQSVKGYERIYQEILKRSGYFRIIGNHFCLRDVLFKMQSKGLKIEMEAWHNQEVCKTWKKKSSPFFSAHVGLYPFCISIYTVYGFVILLTLSYLYCWSKTFTFQYTFRIGTDFQKIYQTCSTYAVITCYCYVLMISLEYKKVRFSHLLQMCSKSFQINF